MQSKDGKHTPITCLAIFELAILSHTLAAPLNTLSFFWLKIGCNSDTRSGLYIKSYIALLLRRDQIHLKTTLQELYLKCVKYLNSEVLCDYRWRILAKEVFQCGKDLYVAHFIVCLA